MDTNNELSTEVVQDDLTRAIEDEYGALYSEEGKRLLKIKNKELSEYSIKDGTEAVCDGAFYGCETIKNVNIPGSVTVISGEAFSECVSLSGFVVAECNECYCSKDGVLYSKDKTRLVKFPASSPLLPEFHIPYGVKEIYQRAFNKCTGLRKVSIPDSVIKIGRRAFAKCTGLTEVAIPDNVTEIGAYAFADCMALKQVIMPNSLTTMGEDVFENCKELTEMTIPDGVTEIGGTFNGCTKLKKVTIPDSVTEISGTFRGCAKLKKVAIPDGVTKLDYGAFSGCKGLTRVKIPDSVTEIGKHAFSDCTGLTKIIIPDSVTKIGEWAFSDCVGLIRVTIGDGVTEIDWSFDRCSSLMGIEVASGNKCYCSKDGVLYSKDMKKLIMFPPSSPLLPEFHIPYGVTEICSGAFYACVRLKKVTIPASVATIGDAAFYCCGDGDVWEYYGYLREMFSLNHEPPKCEGTDYEWAKHTRVLYVPKGSKEAYSSAKGWKLIGNIKEIENTEKCPTDAFDENNVNNFQNCIIPNIPYEKVNEIKEFLLGVGITNVEGLYSEFGGRLGFIHYWDKCLLVNKRGEMIGGPYDRIILLSGGIALCIIYKGTHYYGSERAAIYDKQFIVDFNGKVMAAVEGGGEIEMASKIGNVLLLKQKRFTDYEISQIKDNVNIERNRCTCPNCNEKLGRDFFFDRPEDGRMECGGCGELVLGYEIKDFIDYLPALNKVHILSALNFSDVLKAKKSVFSEYPDYYDDQFTSIRADETAFKYLEEVTNQELYSMFSLVSRRCLIPFQPNEIIIGNTGICIQTDIDRIRNCEGRPYSKKYAKDQYFSMYSYGDDDLFFEGEVAEHIDYTFVNGPCLGLTLLQAFKKKYKALLGYLYSRSLQISNEAVSELMATYGEAKQKIRGLIFAKDVAFNFRDIESSDDRIYAAIKFDSAYSPYSSKIIRGVLMPFYYDLSFYEVFKKDPRYIINMVRSGQLSISDVVLDEVSDLEGYSELLEIVQYMEAERRAQEEYERSIQYSRECENDVRQARRDFEDMMNDFDAWGNID